MSNFLPLNIQLFAGNSTSSDTPEITTEPITITMTKTMNSDGSVTLEIDTSGASIGKIYSHTRHIDVKNEWYSGNYSSTKITRTFTQDFKDTLTFYPYKGEDSYADTVLIDIQTSTTSTNNSPIKLYSSKTVGVNFNDTESSIELDAWDWYSENEIQIGYWIDGKPIYRKVFNVTLQNQSNWTNLINIPNLDKLINVYGFCRNITIPRYESSSYYTQFLFENNYLKYKANGNSGSASIVIEYTKTTG